MRQAPATRSRWSNDKGGGDSRGGDGSGRERSAKAEWLAVLKEVPSVKRQSYFMYEVQSSDCSYNLNELNFRNEAAYEALANGSVDFTLEVSTWEGVDAELKGIRQRGFRYADYGVPDEHTTVIASSDAYLQANPKAASAFVEATRRGYQFAVDHPQEAGDLLIASNKDALTDPALIHASLKMLVEGHFLRSEAGVIGTIDKAKIEAMGDYLFNAGILLDADGKALKERPDFGAYFTNEFLA
jgi:ABC-type nitrate/sulfonate/bicarbonate transport system substrate-binding protein